MGRQQHTQEADTQMATLLQGRVIEELPRGSMLYTPDTNAEYLFLLVSGTVGLYLMEADRRATIWTVGPKQAFGLVTIAGDAAYDSYAEAQSAVRFYRIPRAAVYAQIRQEPALALSLLDMLNAYRQEASVRLDDVAFKSVPARLASVLLDMASDSGTHQVPRRSHRQLAEMINSYRETVTKVINQFRAARLVEIDSAFFTLVNRSGLEELAQGW